MHAGFRSLLDRVANHPWLIGDPEADGASVLRRARTLLIAGVVIANLVGAAVVTAFAALVLPKPEAAAAALPVNLALAGAYLAGALAVGILWGLARLEAGPSGLRAWLSADAAPDRRQRDAVIEAPLDIMVVQGVLWGLATVAFAALNALFDGLLALGVGLTVALGGATTSSAAFLLTELAVRPVAARMFAHGTLDSDDVRTASERWLLSWALGTGVPVVGLVLIGIVALTPVTMTERELALSLVVLGAITLVCGSSIALLAAHATFHPLRSLRRAVERVREGDLGVRLRVWDTTEVGLLQAGFNEMVGGLRERERIRDLFGRHVGDEVAQRALGQGVELGGETREVAVLFVDIEGSTRLAARREPQEVVSLLNRFFAEVVDVVEDCEGFVNKFEGDAALAIFGAPLDLDDPAGRALRAARTLDGCLRERVPELDAGIGVARGEVVAGNVGSEERFEYTAIGDPVNEAARLSDEAKGREPAVLASGHAVEGAGPDEADRWELGEQVELRGRPRPTQLACPRAVEAVADRG